jgi:ssDNA-binding Zn-finger/Zn-ribbon topoisomerase 1
MEAKKSVFEVLNAVNCNEHTEKKNGLTYLSWAWAWAEVKKRYPSATYTIYENKDGLLYHTDGKTAWVKTGVTIEGIELIEYLPVMNYKNESISLDRLTSFDVNKTVQRSLTKACARHGLGLYIYAGEDLPEEEQPEKPLTNTDKPIVQDKEVKCPKCGKVMIPLKKSNGQIVMPEDILKGCGDMCFDCYQAEKK